MQVCIDVGCISIDIGSASSLLAHGVFPLERKRLKPAADQSKPGTSQVPDFPSNVIILYFYTAELFSDKKKMPHKRVGHMPYNHAYNAGVT